MGVKEELEELLTAWDGDIEPFNKVLDIPVAIKDCLDCGGSGSRTHIQILSSGGEAITKMHCPTCKDSGKLVACTGHRVDVDHLVHEPITRAYHNDHAAAFLSGKIEIKWMPYKEEK